MNKGLLVTLGLLAVTAGIVYGFNIYKKKEFDKNCLAKGGRIIESGGTCDFL